MNFVLSLHTQRVENTMTPISHRHGVKPSRGDLRYEFQIMTKNDEHREKVRPCPPYLGRQQQQQKMVPMTMNSPTAHAAS